MIKQNNYENNITIRDATILFSMQEIKSLTNQMNEQNIGVDFFETRSFQNSIFDGIFIYLNNPLVEAIATGILTSLAYDALKKLVRFVSNRIFGSIHSNPDRDILHLRMKLGDIEVTVSIPKDLNDIQFEQYMDALKGILCDISSSISTINHKKLIIRSNKMGNITVETMEEYVYNINNNSGKNQAIF